MNTATQPQEHCSVEDYLEGEQHTDAKHEYLAGQIVAMGGASDRHGLIAMSLAAWLLPHARRKGCQVFSSDMKVRIDHEGDSWFYYPDVALICDPADRESPYYRRNPCLLVEVLSPSTEHIDSREKLLAYRLLPGLHEYLMLRQDRAQADLYQRGSDGRWQHWRFVNASDALPLACLDAQPTLRDIYADLPELL
ncbi:MAG: Uma2 family endonuclease [Acidovorax sp.]|uniref:Uma2 family endonuclease n=1 Tax=Acidovorax sp. TaxID=1872122 RepID=UPI0039E6A99A